MDASNFFSKLLKQPKTNAQLVEVDDIGEFDRAWKAIQVGILVIARLKLMVRIH
jgi:hypothetical protein